MSDDPQNPFLEILEHLDSRRDNAINILSNENNHTREQVFYAQGCLDEIAILRNQVKRISRKIFQNQRNSEKILHAIVKKLVRQIYGNGDD